MPGFSSECVSGVHAACTMGTECRCSCHQHTQALIKKGPGKPDPKGGIRRKRLTAKITEMVGSLPQVTAVPEVPEESIACGTCGNQCRLADNFCRKCGLRLRGKECERCGMGGESSDVFCAQCGWKFGEKLETLPPTQSSSPATEALKADLRARLAKSQAALTPESPNGQATAPFQTDIPEEDTIVRLKRRAIEQGLLRSPTSPGTPS